MIDQTTISVARAFLNFGIILVLGAILVVGHHYLNKFVHEITTGSSKPKEKEETKIKV